MPRCRLRMRLLALVVITAVAISLIVAVDRRQVLVARARNDSVLADECRVACSRFESALATRLAAVSDIASVLSVYPRITSGEFSRLSRAFASSHSSIESLHYLDTDRVVLREFPASVQSTRIPLTDDAWLGWFETCAKEAEAVPIGPVDGADGRVKLVVMATVDQEGASRGYAVCVHDFGALVAEAFPELDSSPFAVSFRDEAGRTFFGPEEYPHQFVSKTVAACGGFWSASLGWRERPPAADPATRLALWVGGLLLASALVILVHRVWWRAEWLDVAVLESAAELERTNEALRAEMAERNKADRALERESELVSRIVKTSPVSIIVTDGDGRIVLANTLARETLSLGVNLTGLAYNAPEWRITDLEGRPFPDEQLPFLRVKRTGQAAFGVKHAIQLANGRTKVLSINAAPLFTKDGEFDGIVAAVEDITERYEQEKKLKESETRYRELFRTMSSGVAVFRAVDDGDDFMIVDFNAAAERIEDISLEDIVGRRVTEAFPGVAEFGLLDVMKRVWQSGRAEEHPLAEYKDGRVSGWRSNSVYRLPTGEVVAVYDDITEQKRAEEAVECLARLPNENPNPVLRISAGGNVAYANAAAETLLKASGTSVGSVAPDEWRESARRALETGEVIRGETDMGGRRFLFCYFPAEGSAYTNVYGFDVSGMS